jgi:hypothetical protein
LCNRFGFIKGYHPFIYISNGVAIGGAEEFTNYVKLNFNNFIYEPSDNLIYNLTQENIKSVNEEYLKRKNGLSLREKIDEKLSKMTYDETYSTINEPYKLGYENGMIFYYKISKKFNPVEKNWVRYQIPAFIKSEVLTIEEKLPEVEEKKDEEAEQGEQGSGNASGTGLKEENEDSNIKNNNSSHPNNNTLTQHSNPNAINTTHTNNDEDIEDSKPKP